MNLTLSTRALTRLRKTRYAKMALSEKIVSIGEHESTGTRLSDTSGSPRLESHNFVIDSDDSTYILPMLQHPMRYHSNTWREPVDCSIRKNAILFSGNTSKRLYDAPEMKALFGTVSRTRLIELAKEAGILEESGYDKILATPDRRVIRVTGEIPFQDFRACQARFDYFLCAPGTTWPLCHNLPEAMSVGTIPVLQRSYANLLDPPLKDGINAIIFQGESDYISRIVDVFSTSQLGVDQIRRNVLEYYHQNFTPKAVVNNILSPRTRSVRIITRDSIKLLEEKHALGSV